MRKVEVNHYSNVEKALNWLLQYAPARLTGAGACVFAEFDNEAEAQAVLRQKPEAFLKTVAKRTQCFSVARNVEASYQQSSIHRQSKPEVL